MRTMFKAAPAILFALALAGCNEDPASPKLCLLTSAELGGQDPLAVACPDPPPIISLTKGETYYVRHELPQGIEPPGKLHLRIDTVCGTIEQLDVDYGTPAGADAGADAGAGAVGPVVVVARSAPPGAECSLVVSAIIANSSLSEATRPQAGASDCACAAGAGDAGDGG